MSSEKQNEYASLVCERKQCSRCEGLGLANPSRCAGRVYDSDEIGPWTRWQGNLDAELMVVGQDWGDDSCFSAEHRGVDSPTNPTNCRLRELLGIAGFPIEEVGKVSDRGTLFFTNAILCLKKKPEEKSRGLSAPVKSAWFNECGPTFLKRQIKLVEPRIVVALGGRAYRAICRAFDKTPEPSVRSAVELGVVLLSDTKTYLFPVYHCSPRVLASHRKLEEQKKDWLKLGEAMKRLKGN